MTCHPERSRTRRSEGPWLRVALAPPSRDVTPIRDPSLRVSTRSAQDDISRRAPSLWSLVTTHSAMLNDQPLRRQLHLPALPRPSMNMHPLTLGRLQVLQVLPQRLLVELFEEDG